VSGATGPSYGSRAVSSERGENGSVYVTVVGELDLSTLPELERALEADAAMFVVDLVDCDFIDSTALGVLVAARDRVDRLALIASAPEIHRMLAISGLDRIIPVYGSRRSLDESQPLVGPDDREARRQAHTRDVNEWIERAHESSGVTQGIGWFRCECGDGSCKRAIALTRIEYESARALAARFVIAPNHEHPDDRVVAEHERYTIVEKLVGQASRTALRSYPR
jgi:anti-anti-sigma factor